MNKNLTTLYKEARAEIEKIQRWRGGMMDEVRQQANRKLAMVHEVYMLDEVEASLRHAARQFCVMHEGSDIAEDNVKEYIIIPEGMIVVYNTPEEPRDIELSLTWEDLQYALDKQLGRQERLQQSGSDGAQEVEVEEE